MAEIGSPVLFALLLWWSSTGAVLFLVSLPRRTFALSMLGVTGLALAALWGLVALSHTTTVWGAYLAFCCGLALWAWHEMSFLFGFVTGPRRVVSIGDAKGWRRFRHALQTLLYHEVAILVTALGLVVLLWDASNQMGLWAFLLLWVMRLSAKLNIFLGVPNMNEEFLPPHLAFLRSYFCKRRMNALFPISVTLGTVVCIWLFRRGLDAGASDFEAASCLILGVMLALAVLEHWFLVLPVPDAALWRWAMPAAAEVAGVAPVPAADERRASEHDGREHVEPQSHTGGAGVALPPRPARV